MRDTIDMAREAGCTANEANAWATYLKRFEALVRADEREACAKVCEDYTDNSASDHESHGYTCAAAIRARGQA